MLSNLIHFKETLSTYKQKCYSQLTQLNPFVTAATCQALLLVGLYQWLRYDFIWFIAGLVLMAVSLLFNKWLFANVSFISLLHVLYLNVLRSGVYFTMYTLMGALAQNTQWGVFLGAMHLGIELAYSRLNLHFKLIGRSLAVLTPDYVYKSAWGLLLVGAGGLWHLKDLSIFAQMWLSCTMLLFAYAALDWALKSREAFKA